MTLADQKFRTPSEPDAERYAEDVAALAHFSAYIANEARRLGLPSTAEKARLVQCELLSALQHNHSASL